MIKPLSIFLFIFLLMSCQEEDRNELFVLRSSDDTGINFRNDLDINIDLNILNYMYYYNGSGLAVADLNNDDLPDIIFGSNKFSEKVFLNRGNLKFEDISTETKIDGGENSWTNGIAVADINGDGWMDIYLSQVGDYRTLNSTNKLFICQGLDDNGIPHYIEQSSEYGLDFKGFSTQAGFFDYDLDGDLDMYLMNHSLHHNGTFGKRSEFLNTYDSLSGDQLYRNEGNRFVNVTRESGINSSVIGYGLGLAFSDINLDGWPDIYVSNDFHENDYLYINQKDGTFKDELLNQMMHTTRFSMGTDIADINGDIYQDIFVVDMLPDDPVILKSSEGEDALDIFKFKLNHGYNHQYAKNALHLNTGRSAFQEIASLSGVHATDWSWTPLIFDMDMDGNNDIFVSNGIPKRMNDIDYINFISNSDIQYKIQFNQLTETDLEAIGKIPEIKLLNKFYLNQGQLSFSEVSENIGNKKISYSNSAIYADLDNDGDYDLITNNINDEAFIYENMTKAKSLRIKLEGTDKNPNAIGSKIWLHMSDGDRLIENFSTRGFQSSAVGDILVSSQLDIESVTVIWPDQKFSSVKGFKNDSVLVVKQSASEGLFDYTTLKLETDLVISEISDSLNIHYTHSENPFVEFNREPLIPHSNSSEGPALTVADFNNDGLEDIFIGSAKRKYNKLLIQLQDGSFEDTADIGIDSTYEEVESIAVDLDNNGFKDLVIATGGNEFDLDSDYTSPLIIYNVGSSTREVYRLPIHLTASCVTASDVDGDGDQDLFFGSRALPRSYGGDVTHYMMINQGYKDFANQSEKFIPELSQVGMVKDASFEDLDGDGDQDLIVAEEWGPIKAFMKDGLSFHGKVITANRGWWNFLDFEDLDGDGDLDIIAGNLGSNSRLKASKREPVRMYYNDFDDNGSHEQIVSYYVKGKEIPFSNFKEILGKVPSLKKEYLYALDFANASMEDLFGKDKLKSSKVYSVDYLLNCIIENQGNGKFIVHDLSIDQQFSPYESCVVKDFNMDGQLDILLAGNYYDCNIQMGRYDADYGSILVNNGDFNFKPARLSGHLIKGQVKGMKAIQLADGLSGIVVAKNDDAMELIKINQAQ